MTITTWPAALKPQRCNPVLRNFTASGGRTMTGRQQRVLSDAGYWEISLRGIRVWNRAQAAAYRALIARLRQGEDIILPVTDAYLPDGARDPATVASTTLFEVADLRATTIRINGAGIAIAEGHHCTIGDHLYLVTQVLAGPSFTPGGAADPALSPPADVIALDLPMLDEPMSPGVSAMTYYDLKILPPTRAVIPAGEPVRWRDHLCRCEIKTVDEGDLDLDLGRWGEVDLTFKERI